ncbi:MAG: hypothetical protein Q9224_003794 [Gallowayella concinna]
MAKPTLESFSHVLSDETVYANTMYAISKIQSSRNPGRDTSDYENAIPSVKSHIAILDLLALLMVKQEGDTVATGLEIDGIKTTIVWCRNHQQTNHSAAEEERDYLRSLLQSFKQADHPEQTLEIAIGWCRKKIMNRIRKFTREYPNVPDITPADPATEEYRQFLIKRGAMDDVPLAAALLIFVDQAKELSSMPHYTAPLQTFKDVVISAFWLTCHKVTPEHLPGFRHDWFRKVQKIGSYYLACGTVHSALRRLDSKSPLHRQNLSIRQAHPPPTREWRVYGDTLKAFNVWTQRHNIAPIINFGAVLARYPSAKAGKEGDGFSGTTTVVASQHCELTVGLDLWYRRVQQQQQQQHKQQQQQQKQQQQQQQKQQTQAPEEIFSTPVEVGCSKASCHYCGLYLDKFNQWCRRNQAGPPIFVRGLHHKNTEGWMMPRVPTDAPDQMKNGFTEAGNSTLEGIGDRIHTMWLEMMNPRRLSDSLSPPPNTDLQLDLEEMATSMKRPNRGGCAAPK